MIQEVKLPEVSENVESGDVVKVLVKVGDTIEMDQAIIELETDKSTFEVPSTAKGKVTEVNVKEGESINIGAVIIKVETEEGGEEASKEESKEGDEKADKKDDKEEKKDEKETEKKSEKAPAKTEKKKDEVKEDSKEDSEEGETEEDTNEEKKPAKKEAKKEDSKEEKTEEETGEQDDKPVDDNKKEAAKTSSNEDKITSDAAPASPSVRRLARELGIELADVSGSGPSGRISEDDVKSFVKQVVTQKNSTGGGGAAVYTLPDFSKWGDIKTEPMTKVRRLTAKSMTHAWTTVPMVTQFDKADITSLEEFRKKYGKTVEEAKGQLTVTSILVKVITAALKKFPQFNCSIDMSNEEIIYKEYYNIGIAVDTDRGLLVPVIKDADTKNIVDISVELTGLAEKTREKKIKPDEMEGGTFTISNLGGIGGTNFTPIVYAPQVAILGVSRASKEPVYKESQFVPRFMLPLSLTYDHRIIDGADAARFLRWVCEALENPYTLLL